MNANVIHSALLVLTAFVVTYSIRATPFILFGTRKEVPSFIRRFGDAISPLVITGLVIYSFSGLEWRTFAPYLAGTVAVLLQLWKRNGLISILTATAIYMWLVK